MNCKDCIHYDVCEDNLKYIQERFLKGLTFGKSEFTDGEFCNHFKDKSRIVELPCKVGETVHYITYHKNKYDYHYIINASFDILFQLFHEKEIGYVIYMTDDKSKAEAKLKELNDSE